VTRVYIRHPETRQWHELIWEHASEFPMAFSDEGWKYARRTVLDKHGFVDERVALDEMLTRHKLHMGDSPAERRIILRMSREDAALSHQTEPDEADLVRALPSVKRVLPQTGTPSSTEPNGWYDAKAGDDDSDDDLDDDYDVDELEWT
jgi:hypothetical protein